MQKLKIRNWLTRIMLIWSLTTVFFAANGSAETKAKIWVSPTGELTTDAILVMEIDDKAYLFLPGNIELEDYRIGFSSQTASVNGEEIVSGETSASVLNLDEPNKIELSNGKSGTKMTLLLERGSRIPSMHITTESGTLKSIHHSKSNKEPGSMVLYDSDGDPLCESALKHFKMRGNASTQYKKKNYAIKLEKGENLLGMGKAKKWILLGNHLDKSLIRNQITFAMARYAGLMYTPDCQQIALYVNHEYMGLYLLTEKIEIDDDRVDIRDLEKETQSMNEQELSSYPIAGSRYVSRGKYKGVQIPNELEDISGGYILEFEHVPNNYDETPSAYFTKREMCLLIHSPEYCSDAQAKYITEIMQGFENAIFEEDGRDPETGKHYSEFLDFDSLVNKYLINEVSRNYDSNMSSEYFYKPDDSVSTKVYAGPVWDLDNTYGDYSRSDNSRILSPKGLTAGAGGGQHYWWPALYKQPDFREALEKRYAETFVPAMEILLGMRKETPLLKSIDTYASEIRESAEMEFVRYPHLKYKQGEVQTGKDPEENISYLKDYISRRMEYLSGLWIEHKE